MNQPVSMVCGHRYEIGRPGINFKQKEREFSGQLENHK